MTSFFYEKEATNIQKKRNFLKNRDLDLSKEFFRRNDDKEKT